MYATFKGIFLLSLIFAGIAIIFDPIFRIGPAGFANIDFCSFFSKLIQTA